MVALIEQWQILRLKEIDNYSLSCSVTRYEVDLLYLRHPIDSNATTIFVERSQSIEEPDVGSIEID